MMSVNMPQGPFCAASQPMKVNLRLLMSWCGSTETLAVVPLGKVVDPPSSGK
jgi:hypothetical protein